MKQQITLGTRKSPLAIAQSEQIKTLLEGANPGISVVFCPIITEGDKSQTHNVPLPSGGLKGLWTFEMEQMLESGEIDIAVHSMKDVSTIMSPKFVIGAVPMREDRRDVLISRHGESFSALPFGGIVGTSSFRRASQVKMFRPDLRVEIIRGNVDTRLRKLYDPVGQFSAIIVAAAGVKRLGLEERISEFFAEELWLPSAGQGALAVQCLADRAEIVELLKGINDPSTSSEVRTERAFIDTLGGSCNAAIGASAKIEGGSQISLQVVLFNISSLEEILADRRSAISIRDCAIFLEGNAPVERGEELGRELAEKMLRLKG